MAPDRPDASDLEAGGGGGGVVVGPVATRTYVFCDSYAAKEEVHQQFVEETTVMNDGEIVIEAEIKPEEEVKPEMPVVADDDLTSLTWLHQQNLLKGLEITDQPAAKNGKDENALNNNNVVCEDSLDVSENTNSVSSLDDSYSPGESNGQPSEVCSQHFVDYEVVTNGASPAKQNHDVSTSPTNTSPNGPNRNKHPTHIPYDPHVHKNSKPPYSFSCLIFMAIEESPVKALPVKEVYAWILENFPYFRNAPTGWKNSVRHNLSLNKCFRKVEKSPNLGKGSLWMVDPQYRPNLLQALNRAPFLPPNAANLTTPEKIQRKSSNTRLPDPNLFPYLSKRLASSNVDNDECEFDSDVDAAAAAMLSFKHGPIILNHNKVFVNEDDIFNDVDPKKKRPEEQTQQQQLQQQQQQQQQQPTLPQQQPERMVPVITRSSTEDHTYSLITSVRLERRRQSNTDVDEQRKIAEGADALLNLAGVTTEPRDPLAPDEQEEEPFNMLYGSFKGAPSAPAGSDPLEISQVVAKRRPSAEKRRKRPWQEAWNANGRYPKQVRS